MGSRLHSDILGARGVLRLAVASALVLAAAALWAPGATVVAAEPPHACPPKMPESIDQGTPGKALLSRLAVLRRPQTAEDQLPPGPNAPEPPLLGEGIYVNYIRHAATVDGAGYYLVPVQRALRAGGCPAAEEVLLVRTEPGSVSSSGVTARGLLEGKDVGTRWFAGHSTVYGIVPDGVARVTIRYVGPGRHRLINVNARPVNNVFFVPVPAAVAGSALPVVPSAVVWRSRKGRVMKTIHTGG
jgi:hypothetical protein